MERRAIVIRGIVQGVGFRPFVFGLAFRLRLAGFVRNDAGAVAIEVEGQPAALDRFLAEISEHPPTLARIESVWWEKRELRGEAGFRIEASQFTAEGAPEPIFVSPDIATCANCLSELFDPDDERRFGYPFINCTNCGPRLTIVTGAPYDRARTEMRSFQMCSACQAEYDDPQSRRFHAQPTCCKRCGPKLEMLDANGKHIDCDSPDAEAARALAAGKIVAIKGIGGFHLACSALDEQVVRKLRASKHREEKPFAIMVADVAAARRFCDVSHDEALLLTASAAPIVLLKKRTRVDSPSLSESIAPGNPSLGVMLPYTPLHHLLISYTDDLPLVMTSGNRSDEPIAYENEDAVKRLHGIAEVFLVHNRSIHLRCDDSVTRVVDGKELPIRRSRGVAPQPITLPLSCTIPTLAVGGQLKGTFAIGRDRHAFVSHHLGDLDHYEAFKAFERDVALYEQLFAVRPRRIVHDLHPDYASTNYARGRASAEEIPLVSVQHHHAHMASCMAENDLDEPVIGICFDGTGYGLDGAVWGGEFLVGDYRAFRRAAHLRYVRMPGADTAIREPWRMALAHLLDADAGTAPLQGRISQHSLKTIGQMIERGFNSPLTSSVGRLFDAVASLVGVRDRVSYEGQAAIELEWLASQSTAAGVYQFEMTSTPCEKKISEKDYSHILDTRDIIRSVVKDIRDGAGPSVVARRFHSTMAQIILQVCRQLRNCGGPNVVVLSGGVFMNVLLTREAVAGLKAGGFQVYAHHLVPPNDAGISLGQLAIAAAGELSAGPISSSRSE